GGAGEGSAGRAWGWSACGGGSRRGSRSRSGRTAGTACRMPTGPSATAPRRSHRSRLRHWPSTRSSRRARTIGRRRFSWRLRTGSSARAGGPRGSADRGPPSFRIGVDRDPVTGAPRPLATHASNMGWLLGSRLLDRPELQDRREQIVELLFSDEFLADGGIRTLSSREARFRPRAYHNGNVWGFDN